MKTELKWLTERPIAHRGLYSHIDPVCPENSRSAFERAVEAGYAIELDVQVTADQEVVIFHDEDLGRMCGKPGSIGSLFARDLEYCRLRADDRATAERIPKLTEVFELVAGRVPLLIDIKRQPEVKAANDIILKVLLEYKGPFAIQSFDPMILGWFAKQAPFIVRGQLSSDFKEEKLNFFVKYLLRNFWLNFISKPHFVAYDVRDMPRRRLARMRKRGMVVLGWTVDSEDCSARVREYCDNIIFEGFRPG